MLSIDIVIPTFRRPAMLSRTLESIETCEASPDVVMRVIVVDNNSRDETERVVREFAARGSIDLTYLLETKPGRSAAVNAGVRASLATYVAFLDDDERLFPDWQHAASHALRSTGADYVGGPMIGDFSECTVPDWVPPDWPGVLGDLRGPGKLFAYSRESGAFFMGGNGILRRQVFLDIGMYNPALGRTGNTRLMSCEDRDLFDRLLDHEMKGYFVPEMKVWHHVPPERVTQSYFRRWSFDHGASLSMYTRLRGSRAPRSFLGIELWVWRATALHLGRLLRGRATGASPAARFSSELHVRELAGRLRGLFYPLPNKAA